MPVERTNQSLAASRMIPPKNSLLLGLMKNVKILDLTSTFFSFLNLFEGKVFCVMEAPSKKALDAWFQKTMPFDYITPVELEGERGVVKET